MLPALMLATLLRLLRNDGPESTEPENNQQMGSPPHDVFRPVSFYLLGDRQLGKWLGLLPKIFKQQSIWAGHIHTIMVRAYEDQIARHLGDQQFVAEMELEGAARDYYAQWRPFFNMHMHPQFLAHAQGFELYLESRFKVGFSLFYESWQSMSTIPAIRMLNAKFDQAERLFISGDFAGSQACLIRVDQDLNAFDIPFSKLEGYQTAFPLLNDVRTVVATFQSSQEEIIQQFRRGQREINIALKDQLEKQLSEADDQASRAEWFAINVISKYAEWGTKLTVDQMDTDKVSVNRKHWLLQQKKWHPDRVHHALPTEMRHAVSLLSCYPAIHPAIHPAMCYS